MEKQLSLFTEKNESSLPTTKKLVGATSYSFKIFFDGAARGNPGKAGAGIYIVPAQGSPIKLHFFLGVKTNNQAEYLALALASFYLKNYKKESTNSMNVTFLSDSELLIRQMNKQYQVKNDTLIQLKKLIHALLGTIRCTFHHIPREQNKEADTLANLGVDQHKQMPQAFSSLLLEYNLFI